MTNIIGFLWASLKSATDIRPKSSILILRICKSTLFMKNYVGLSSMSKSSADTPLMQQHRAIKQKYPDAILLFRVGDFYETFGSDA
ncbi:MAG: hypothetical protein WCL22_03775, partial [bacterium]